MATSRRKKDGSVKTFSGCMRVGTRFRGSLHRELAQDPAKVESEARRILDKIALYWRNPVEFRLDYPEREFDPQYGMELGVDDWVRDKNEREANHIDLAWRRLLNEKGIAIERSDGKKFVRPLDADDPQGSSAREMNLPRDGRRPRKRGRPSDTDHKADRQVFEAWKSSGCKSFENFARQSGKPVREVKLAIDRHRQRHARIKKRVPDK